jgi:CheY-like chemotaxis protein
MKKESILNNKRILAVDDEPDILEILKEEIKDMAPDCTLETATNYDKAVELLVSWTYDLAILDIMGIRGLDLLDLAMDRPIPVPVVIFTGKALAPQSLMESIKRGARAYLSKENLGDVVTFLEDVLNYEYGPVWKRALKQLEGIFNEGWGPYWRKPDEKFWKKFEKKIDKR